MRRAVESRRRGRATSIALAAVALAALVSGAFTARGDRSATAEQLSPVADTADVRLPSRLVDALALLERAIDSDLDPDAAARLRLEAALARGAMGEGELVQARALLDAFDDTVRRMREDRGVGDQKAADVLAAFGDVEDAFAAWVARG